MESSEIALNDYPVYVVTYSLRFDYAAANALFYETDGVWYIEGRGSQNPAQVVQSRDTIILRGSADYGLSTKDSPSYVGLGEAFRAVVGSTEPFTVIIEADYAPLDGLVQVQDAFNLILATLHFLE